jgi:diguanylate cyclase (GGDEF)-like protein
VVVTDPAGGVLLANQGALDLMGRIDADLSTPDGRRLDLTTLSRSGESCEALLTRPDGTTSDILIEVVPIEGGVGTVFALLDLGAQRAFEESLHHAAYHDTLTGLPNRAMLWQHLNAAAAGEGPYAVLLIDLDDFRTVNDVHGHRTGDELLAGAAHRLRDAAYAATRRAPQRAVVARLGGDEFAVLLPGADARTANRLAALLRAAFDQPFPTGVGRLMLRGTVEVLTDADTALDRARAA